MKTKDPINAPTVLATISKNSKSLSGTNNCKHSTIIPNTTQAIIETVLALYFISGISCLLLATIKRKHKQQNRKACTPLSKYSKFTFELREPDVSVNIKINKAQLMLKK